MKPLHFTIASKHKITSEAVESTLCYIFYLHVCTGESGFGVGFDIGVSHHEEILGKINGLYTRTRPRKGQYDNEQDNVTSPRKERIKHDEQERRYSSDYER